MPWKLPSVTSGSSKNLILTQEDVSQKVGKDRATVSNYIRLLKLPPEVQYALRHEQISMGHARSLISNSEIPNSSLRLFYGSWKKDYQSGKRKTGQRHPGSTYGINQPKQAHCNNSSSRFKRQPSTAQKRSGRPSVSSEIIKGKGSLVIKFGSEADLERILGILNKDNLLKILACRFTGDFRSAHYPCHHHMRFDQSSHGSSLSSCWSSYDPHFCHSPSKKFLQTHSRKRPIR